MRQYSSSSRLALLAFITVLFGGGFARAAGLTFNVTYDTSGDAFSLSSYPPYLSGQLQSAVNYVTNEYSTDFTNSATVNITIGGSPSIGLGESETYLWEGYGYDTVRSALLAQTPSDSADLPAIDPTGGASFAVSTALAKAVALQPASSSPDGLYYFNTTYGYTFDPANRAVPGEFDFIGVAEHEISEVMGRASYLDDAGFGYDTPFDLFRYSAPGVRSLSGSTNALGNAVSDYFSIDNGTTDLKNFNDISGGDISDWANQYSGDSYDAYTNFGEGHVVTPVDIQAMNAIGYVSAVPEPASLSLLAAGGIGLLGLSWRTRRRRARYAGESHSLPTQ